MISLCMITKDEEANLQRCLRSVIGYVDEIIIVDTGSTDNTLGIAAEFGAKIQNFLWNENFSDARNAGLALADGDWVLFLDADEELAAGSGSALLEAVRNETIDGYFLKIDNYIGGDGQMETCSDMVFRLFRNSEGYRFRGAVHEQIISAILEQKPQAQFISAEEIVLLHYGYLDSAVASKDKKRRNLKIIEKEIAQKPNDQVLKYHYGVELYRIGEYEQAAKILMEAGVGVDAQAGYMPKLARYVVLAWHAAGKRTEALTAAETALKNYPDYADIYFYQGILHYENRDFGQAFDCMQKALQTPSQPTCYASFSGTRGFRANYYLGLVAEMFENGEEAMRYYLAALRENPGFGAAMDCIIRLLRPHREPESACQSLSKICELCTPQANLWVAQILLQRSAYQAAWPYLTAGAQGGTGGAQLQLWQAICLIQQRRFLEALQILERFDANDPQYAQARFNTLLAFWFDGGKRKVRQISDELFDVGLAEDTGAVVAMLNAAQNKRARLSVSLGEDGILLLLDILKRSLDLAEIDKARSLMRLLEQNCIEENAGLFAGIFADYGYFEEARTYYQLFAAKNPDSAEACFQLGKIDEECDRLVEAVSRYRKAIELDPKMPMYTVRLANLYRRMRQIILQDAAKNYPESLLGRLGEAEVQ